ncbi:transcription factor PAP1-domain-containing protein [Xylariomycetidae sp. FL0641]|nr:transcription factor PAP1-domain-containing protein [Xylariomycetidae sp. FL0641]
MASTHANVLPNFILTPQQQSLLFRALTSNQPGNNANAANANAANANAANVNAANTNANPDNNALSLSPSSLTNSPAQNQNQNMSERTNGTPGTQESPFLDYDESGFDFDFGSDGQLNMIGNLPGATPDKDTSKASSPDQENPEKRSHPDEDDEEEEEGGGKRRESEGKVPKKPGRKPLTNEPSSKRKAQNRAAQRAFRERKEKHLKDLETKVEELEKASAAANNENSQLRAQVDKMTLELDQYKKRLSVMGGSNPRPDMPRNHHGFGGAAISNINDVNFQFEFPKFGVLPGPSYTSSNGGNGTRHSSNPSSSGNSPNSHVSPGGKTKEQTSPSTKRDNSDSQAKDAISRFAGVFNNSALYDGTYGVNGSRTSLDSAQYSVNGGNGGSPSSSSNSNMGPSSSCGTSPEPFTQSPLGFKPLETLTTIGEEQSGLTSGTATASGFDALGNIDFTNFDWLSQQNGGQFDPQLFSEYREPQDNILANTSFDDSFFNDAFDIDFTTPYNVPAATNPAAPPKKDICAEIDAKKEADDDTIVTAPNGKLLTCNNIWEKLQGCPRVQAGDLDLDGLCSDLQKKAKCGGSGAVVDELDFKTVMKKYLGDDVKCPDSKA